MKRISQKLFVFFSLFALLLAGYSANTELVEYNKKSVDTEKSSNHQDESILKAVSFEATPSFFQSSFHRFSFLIYSFEFDFGVSITQHSFFPAFTNSFKEILFSRISPVNAP